MTDAWTTAPSVPTARFGLGVGVVNGVLYAMGGTTDDLGAFAVVEAFTPTTPGVGPPTNKDQCKSGGLAKFNTPRKVKEQSDCILFVQTRKKDGGGDVASVSCGLSAAYA